MVETSAAPDSYLVTGGNGLLGRHIVQQLLERGERAVAVLDIVAGHFDDTRVRVFVGDITDEAQVAQTIQDCAATCIIHTAALIQGAPRPALSRVNVDGTVTLLRAARAAGVRKLVFTSSASVVFDGRDQAGVNEDVPYPAVPFDDYNATKAHAERVVLAADGQDGLRTVSLRVAGLFGPGDRHAIPSFMGALAAGRTGTQIGPNTNLFDWTYIANAAHAHLLAADRLSPSHPRFPSVAGRAFFVTNGEPWPFWNFPRAIWATAGHVPGRVTVMPRWLAWVLALLMEAWAWATGGTPMLNRFRVTYVCTTRWCDISRAREALDYEPIVSMEEGIRRSVEWWQELQKSQKKQE
ncbi:hypothetical protein AcV5_000403 [Taiwanofungus camphoratus]|nr:hypothetical protein AcV5_000403 [Antrodia cinnamomea]